MKALIAFAFAGILVALGSALLFLVRGSSGGTVKALTVRVALSVLLLLFIWFSYWMGWIEPRRYP